MARRQGMQSFTAFSLLFAPFLLPFVMLRWMVQGAIRFFAPRR